MTDLTYTAIVAVLVISLLGIITTTIVILNQRALRKKDRETFNQLLETQAAEQERIGRDLHDSLGPHLVGIQALLQSKLRVDMPQNKPWIEQSSQLLDSAIEQLRKISHNLVSLEFREQGLEKALQSLCERLDSPDQSVAFICNVDTTVFKETKAQQIYKIAAELVLNAKKHSKATTINLSLEKVNDILMLRCQDNGCGMEGISTRKQQGSGIQNIETRVQYLSAQMDISKADPNGTIVQVQAPLSLLSS